MITIDPHLVLAGSDSGYAVLAHQTAYATAPDSQTDFFQFFGHPWVCHSWPRPLVGLDETTKKLTRETRTPLPVTPGYEARFDYEYERAGVASLFMLFAPLGRLARGRDT